MASELIDKLVASKCLKYGNFILKSGATSPHYIDLREASHHLDLWKSIMDNLETKIKEIIGTNPIERVALVGVPNGATGLAFAAGRGLGCKSHLLQKEKKNHGADGGLASLKDHRFILIEDVMSTGSSIIDALQKLGGANVTDVVVIVDRESGGSQNLKAQYPNLKVHAILRASDILAK